MRGQAGLFDIDERLKEISAKGDDLERLNAIVDFEAFRSDLARAVPRSDGSRGGRPPFDRVFMWKVLILQASHSLSDERTEFLIKDRLSFMRFLGLDLSDPVPDANTIWTFRETLTRATIGGTSAISALFRAYEAALTITGRSARATSSACSARISRSSATGSSVACSVSTRRHTAGSVLGSAVSRAKGVAGA